MYLSEIPRYFGWVVTEQEISASAHDLRFSERCIFVFSCAGNTVLSGRWTLNDSDENAATILGNPEDRIS
jgi:hypothetical protein